MQMMCEQSASDPRVEIVVKLHGDPATATRYFPLVSGQDFTQDDGRHCFGGLQELEQPIYALPIVRQIRADRLVFLWLIY